MVDSLKEFIVTWMENRGKLPWYSENGCHPLRMIPGSVAFHNVLLAACDLLFVQGVEADYLEGVVQNGHTKLELWLAIILPGSLSRECSKVYPLVRPTTVQ